MTILEALEKFVVAKTGQRRKPRTLEFYRENMRRFAAWMAEAGLGDQLKTVTPEVIDQFLAAEATKIGATTLHGRYRALSAMFGWLAKRSDLKKHLHRRRSPVDEVEPPEAPRARQKAVMYEDYIQLLNAIEFDSWVGARDYLAIHTLFLCGVRVSELVRLQIDDYDLDRQLLIIRQGKRGDYEEVPLLEPVARAFAAYLFVRPAWPTRDVFLSADGGWRQPKGVLTRSGVWQMLDRLCRKAGIEHFNPHSFRHGLARYLLNEKDADMAFIQQIMRHKRITTTSEIYARWRMAGVARKYSEIMRDLGDFGVEK